MYLNNISLVNFKKIKKEFKRIAKVKMCFHYDTNACQGKIKKAHSLQKNGVLSKLEYTQNKNNIIFSFSELNNDGFFAPDGFKNLGKKDASTFTGFCDKHDSIIFSPIENEDIDPHSSEHLFLLVYRAFAKEYHENLQQLMGFIESDILNSLNPIDAIESINGAKLSVRDMTSVKEKLNFMLQHKSYENLYHFTYELNYCIPIASASSITPTFSYSGKTLNQSQSEKVVYENVFVNIIPLNGKTLLMLSCFTEDSKSLKYIQEIEVLDQIELQKVFSSIIISEISNTFFSPVIWYRMSKREQEDLIKELFLTNPMFLELHEDFFISQLNLFKESFSI